jgi:hypothetical protein
MFGDYVAINVKAFCNAFLGLQRSDREKPLKTDYNNMIIITVWNKLSEILYFLSRNYHRTE